MRKLFWKEIKEHFKVAAIGFVIFGVLLVVDYRHSMRAVSALVSDSYSNRNETFQPLLASSVLTGAAFFCALFGTLLGWLQGRSEGHRDLWAFLVHRPITRSAILGGKVAGGLTLYAVGASLPWFGLVAVAAVPGHVPAPFEWAMVLPGLSILFAGIGFYFAGLLTALRSARWYGSRIFGIGPALIGILAMFVAPNAWVAFSVVAAAILILAIAVWGSFTSDGCYRGQPRAGKAALTMACAVASLILLACAIGFGYTLFRSSEDSMAYSYFQVTKDGTIYQVTQQGRDRFDVVDLEGKPLIDGETGRPIKQADFNLRLATGQTIDVAASSERWRSYYQRFVSTPRFFSPWQIPQKTLWYLTRDGRLMGYNGVTHRKIGMITVPGSSGRRNAAGGFLLPQNYYYNTSFDRFRTWQRVLGSAMGVYRIDLDHQTAQPVFTAPEKETIIGCLEWAQSPRTTTLDLTVVTHQSIRFIDDSGQVTTTVPYVPSYPNYSALSIYLVEPTNSTLRYVIRFDPDPRADALTHDVFPSQAKWIAADGRVEKSLQVPKLPRSQYKDYVGAIVSAFILPTPVSEMLRPAEPRLSVLHFLVPVLCAAVGWWLGSRYSFSRPVKVGWLAWHLVMGLPGLLAFLAVQEWPAREPCPACRKLRVVDRKNCEHCGAEFAPPAPNGTEIFEPLEVG